MEFIQNLGSSQLEYTQTQYNNSFRYLRSRIDEEMGKIIQNFSKSEFMTEEKLKIALEQLRQIKNDFENATDRNLKNLKTAELIVEDMLDVNQNSG